MTFLVFAFNVLVLAAGVIVAGRFGGLEYLFLGMTLAFGSTGAVIARRQRRNPLGWMFLAMSLGASLAVLSAAVADETGSPLVAAYASASWIVPMLPGLTFLLHLFPDGRPLGPRWRIAVWASGIALTCVLAGTLTAPGPLEDYPAIENPIGWSGSDPLNGLGALLGLAAVASGVVSLVKRFRRAQHLERQQVKWLALSGAFAALSFVLAFAAFDLLPETLAYLIMMTGVLSLPVAAAVAMLRYRLYDIDVVVNRALVYTALTVALAATYLATVLLLQLVLPARSDFAVAVSTLAVAAAFGPARARIQSSVDRRFFRRRYDAARTLLGFGSRLRDEVDLVAVSDELTRVAADTMQPAHVSLWLRER